MRKSERWVERNKGGRIVRKGKEKRHGWDWGGERERGEEEGRLMVLVSGLEF